MFADTLRALMDEKNVKACDLVNGDITAQYLSKLLNGKIKDPTWDKALAIIDRLGITVDEFYKRDKK
ncbi:helix-turn-helix domain-containing protein [Collinsella bouchesdurhonensis]|uniref:helix-turn-helix domain-containing protein n=1 Tax=Collinsella bouchesdurhonensis TaxID=1907654 RepID=UPI0034A18536